MRPMAERIAIRHSSDGYRYLADGHPSEDSSACVLEHRLTAVAWGILDSLADDREVHHVDRSPMHTSESNLMALPRERHLERHVEDAQARGEAPPKWVLSCLPFDVRNDLVDGDGELRETEGRT